jgi:phage-related protein
VREFVRFEYGMNTESSVLSTVTKFAERIYVLHCFQKKTQKTSQADIELAAARYKELQKGQGK